MKKEMTLQSDRKKRNTNSVGIRIAAAILSAVLLVLMPLPNICCVTARAEGENAYAVQNASAKETASWLGGQTTVTPLSAQVYSSNGAEVFLQPDPSTYYTSLPANMILNITGITDNHFYQFVYNGQIFYVYQGGVSTLMDTTAYRVLSFRAKAAYAVDLKSGAALYDQNSLTRLEPASTTKIMTALLVLDACSMGMISLDTPVAMTKSSLTGLPNDASRVSPKLKEGEILTVYQLLMCMMISSDCYASDRLAEVVAGNKTNFAQMMNLKAKQLGCVDTNFIEPSGYPDINHYTNAYSLSLIARAALQYPIFKQIISTQAYVLPATNLCEARNLTNTNLLLDQGSAYYNPYAKGVKTGTAGRAGSCLVTYATDGNKEIMTVILGSSTKKMSDGVTIKGQFFESSRLVNYALLLAQ